MRKPRMIEGLNNSQRIRVLVDGIGFFTTVEGTSDICTRKHRMAVQIALQNLSYHRGMARVRHEPKWPEGFGFNYEYSENGGQTVENIDVQVDLV